LDTFALNSNDKQARVIVIAVGYESCISLLGRTAHCLLLLVVVSSGREARQEKGIIDRDRHGGNMSKVNGLCVGSKRGPLNRGATGDERERQGEERRVEKQVKGGDKVAMVLSL
jgi:hypothetical protein